MTPAAQRILLLGNGWFPEHKGGAESAFYNHLLQLRRCGFEVGGIVPGSRRVEQDTGGTVRSFDPTGRSLLQRAWALRRCSEEIFAGPRPDAIGSHFALYAFPLLDRIAGRPFVTHFHGPWAMESLVEGSGRIAAGAKRMIERTVYRRADRIVVLSAAFTRILLEEYGVSPDVIRRVPGGVDCDRFAGDVSRAEARGILGWEQDRPVLVTVRRLTRRMGLGSLVEAMAMLGRSRRDAVFYIVGKGPERGALEAQVASLGLQDAVRFAGPVSDEQLALAYRAADLAVVPTEALEGFGLVAAEALAAGTPVLVTPVGGLPEVVSGLSGDLVLRGRDPQAIADGIAAALANPGALPDSAACAGYARRHFDWRVVGEQVAAVYRELLASPDRAGAPAAGMARA